MTSNTKQLNHARKKREIANILYEEAIYANPSPNCIANFERPIRDRALEEATRAVEQGYRFSKSNYQMNYVYCTRDIFLTAASKLWITKLNRKNKRNR
jgi:hypothetical protein